MWNFIFISTQKNTFLNSPTNEDVYERKKLQERIKFCKHKQVKEIQKRIEMKKSS